MTSSPLSAEQLKAAFEHFKASPEKDDTIACPCTQEKNSSCAVYCIYPGGWLSGVTGGCCKQIGNTCDFHCTPYETC